MANLGVNVIEVDGRSSPAIAGAPLSNAAFLVRSERGIPNLPVSIQGFVDFVANFGNYTGSAYGAFAVRGFFDNGGSQAFAVRIVGANNHAASLMLADRQAVPANTLLIQAGMRGRPDPGEWGNSLTVQITDHPRGASIIPAQIIGGTTEPFALANGQQLQFTVTVRGVASIETITFHTADFVNIAAATAAEVAAAVARQTTLVQAGATQSGQVVVAAARAGQDAGLARLAVAGTAATPVGFTGATANSDGALVANSTLAMLQSVGGFLPGSAVRIETPGLVLAPNDMAANIADGASISVDGGAAQAIVFTASDFVGGVASITAGEVVAAIRRQARGFSAALAFNNRLVILSNSFGPTSSIAIAAGAPDATAAIGMTAAVPQAGTRNFAAISQISEPYRYVTFTQPLPAVPIAGARIQSVEFDLAVGRNGIELERFESLSRQPALPYSIQAAINDPDTGSRYIMVTPQADNVVGANAPQVGSFLLGSTTAGADGDPPGETDYIGDPPQRSGLYALDLTNFQLLAIPETTAQGVVSAALAYCQTRGDAMFVGMTPRGLDREGAKTYAASFRGRKVFGALYYPWIQIVNPLDTTGANPRIFIPPVGHILGTYARVADARGVWKAPAGDEAQLANALAVDVDLTDAEHTDLVKNGGVSAIRAVPGSGIIIDSSRTLSTDSRWLYIGTRRLFNFVKASLRDGLRWVAQEPHDENLRRAVQFNTVRPFLLGLWTRGAFGSDPADQTFTIKCDADNNPPDQVALGNFTLEVYFYPVKPVETIIIVVGQQDNLASAGER